MSLVAETELPEHPAPRVSGTERHRRDRELFVRLKEHDDQHAREELVERFMGLARQVALRYRRQSEPLEDVMQVAALGRRNQVGGESSGTAAGRPTR